MTTVRGEFELGLYSISETRYFFERLIAKKVCTAFSRTSYKIVPLTNLNKYLYNDKSEIIAPAGPPNLQDDKYRYLRQ
jgi:hypothetical protein